MIRLFSLFLLLMTMYSGLQAQCPGQLELTIEIKTDAYAYENSWSVVTSEGVLVDTVALTSDDSNATVSFSVCIDEDQCVSFNIYDDYGDGIAFGGGFKLYLESALIVDEGLENDFKTVTVNCGPGESCFSAEEVTLGTYTTTFDNHWYVFVPDTSGQFSITTCELTSCDTKIWVYDNCGGFDGVEDNQGTIFYGDNFGGCGEQANVMTAFSKGSTYYIRIGDDSDSCGDELPWSISFEGPLQGCIDPSACNYNPIAVIDDGSCIYPGNEDCPDAPDLVLDQGILASSAYLSTIDNDDPCLIQEGCLTGFGPRDIIRFSTYIENVGELDYYIGPPEEGSDQFTFDNCHNHWHYDGYAEYLLFDETGQEIPIGFKNGFCVIDLGCGPNGQFTYYCNNMGISAGCYDEYWAELECQWIDITDIPDGDYTFVARVNWDNAPDLLGRVEKDSLNNWGQVCINLDRSSGTLQFNIDPDCEVYVDCNGQPYGSAQFDCEGVCGGPALQGDLNNDEIQDIADISLYAEGIMNESIALTNCSDVSADGNLDVMDVMLLTDCLVFGNSHLHTTTGPHDHCQFGLDVTASNEEAELSIIGGEPFEYVDIGIRNPDSKIRAYQFAMSGMAITNATSLTDAVEFTASPMIDLLTNQVMAFAQDSSILERSPEVQPLVRLYYNDLLAEEICIDEVIAIANSSVHRVPTEITGDCLLFSGVNDLAIAGLHVFPNPTNRMLNVQWAEIGAVHEIELINVDGKKVMQNLEIEGRKLSFDVSDLPSGLYWLRMKNEEQTHAQKIVINK